MKAFLKKHNWIIRETCEITGFVVILIIGWYFLFGGHIEVLLNLPWGE